MRGCEIPTASNLLFVKTDPLLAYAILALGGIALSHFLSCFSLLSRTTVNYKFYSPKSTRGALLLTSVTNPTGLP